MAREPDWWYGTGPHWQATLLSPIGALVGEIAMARLRRAKPYRALIPVICVGNFTAGGSGKTPLAILIARFVSGLGREPWFLSRGYGGTHEGPLRVQPAMHTAVRSETNRCCWRVTRRPSFRATAAKAPKRSRQAPRSDAVIIMDDGLQNPALAKKLSIAVVDGDRGFGNGYVIPAGPLRAPLAAQIGLAGPDRHDRPAALRRAALAIMALRGMTDAPFVKAETRATDSRRRDERSEGRRLRGDRQPSTLFFDAQQPRRRHRRAAHVRRSSRLQRGRSRDASGTAANRSHASLVTTEKDFVRLTGPSGHRAELKKRSAALPIETVIEGADLKVLTAMIERAIAR